MKRKKQQTTRKNSNSLRIIAGQWRGRKLNFATAPSLRPTPDRVREMLFNWLQGKLLGTRGLDLFAGSGALGLEAVSRGMQHVTLIENNRAAAEQLHANIQQLKTNQVECFQIDAFQFLDSQPQTFDVIFLDPPFGKNYLPLLTHRILEKQLLTTKGLLYIEHGVDESFDIDSDIALHALTLIKEKTTGQVVSKLFIKQD